MSIAEEGYSTAVERALEILEAVAERSGGMTHSEISRRLDIPKSSATYILRALERRGYLSREAGTGKYRLGLQVLALARGLRTDADLKEVARPALDRLAARTGLTVHLAILDQGGAVYVDKVESSGFIKMDTWVGKRMELHTTGVGKAMVAHLPARAVEALLKGRALRKKTPKSIGSQAALLKDLERVRARGYAVDDEENSLGARCVAAPVFDAAGSIVAAVGVSGTTGQIDRPGVRRTADEVMEAAREISRQLARAARR